jgi:hypothetical protein
MVIIENLPFRTDCQAFASSFSHFQSKVVLNIGYFMKNSLILYCSQKA